MNDVDELFSDLNASFGLDNKGSVLYGVDDINQSIWHILMTPKFGRYRSAYGSELQNYIGVLPSADLQVVVRNFVYNALSRWEPRISVYKDSITLMEIGVSVYKLELRYRIKKESRDAAFSEQFTMNSSSEDN